MADDEIFTGGCLCGALRYRSSASPVRGVICHCELCRRHSGAPALAFVHFPLDAFEWIPAPPAKYQSSDFTSRGFCDICGSTLSMHEEVLSDRVQIAIGSLDAPANVSIDDHVWTRSRIPWFEIHDDLPRHATSSDAVASKATDSA